MTIVVLLLSSALLVGCGEDPDLEERCEEMCTFQYECGREVDECLKKCTVNSAHSTACKDLYADTIECASRSDQTCDGFDACIAVHDVAGQYRRAGCPE